MRTKNKYINSWYGWLRFCRRRQHAWGPEVATSVSEGGGCRGERGQEATGQGPSVQTTQGNVLIYKPLTFVRKNRVNLRILWRPVFFFCFKSNWKSVIFSFECHFGDWFQINPILLTSKTRYICIFYLNPIASKISGKKSLKIMVWAASKYNH